MDADTTPRTMTINGFRVIRDNLRRYAKNLVSSGCHEDEDWHSLRFALRSDPLLTRYVMSRMYGGEVITYREDHYYPGEHIVYMVTTGHHPGTGNAYIVDGEKVVTIASEDFELAEQWLAG